MRRAFPVALLAVSVLFLATDVDAKPGQISVGNVTIWQSAAPNPGAGLFPIGGAGQVNGGFTIAERDGIQIALRAQDRFHGPLAVALKGNKGHYEAASGFSTGDAATWNYDWHVDLRNTGTTLADYDLTLNQTFSPTLFGYENPVDLTFPDLTLGLLNNAILYQSSQNPTFGNDTFDPSKKGTYNLKLTLKPKAGGEPLSVQIQVKVR